MTNSKTKTVIRLSTISLLAISLLSVGFGNTQYAAATTATLTNNTPGVVDFSSDTRTVTFTNADIPVGETITDVDIAVDFEKEGNGSCVSPGIFNDFASEISMSLESPAGTVVNLVFDSSTVATYVGSQSVGQVVVTFDDSATDLVGTTNGGIVTAGTFQPEEPLSAFNDESPQGLWTFTYGDNGFGDHLCFNQFDLTIEAVDTTIEVDIDIKPGSDPNSINIRSMGLVPVAILGSDTFDVTNVDVTTLMFGTASPAHDLTDSDTYDEHIQDVNDDGFDDLVSHYKQKEIGIACGDTEATLTADLLDGTTIEGTDSVNPKCKP